MTTIDEQLAKFNDIASLIEQDEYGDLLYLANELHRRLEVAKEALAFYASDDAATHVDEEVKQEYISGKGWSDFGDFARETLAEINKPVG